MTAEVLRREPPQAPVDTSGRGLLSIEQLVLAVLPALFVSASVGEEIEDKTTAYLWSRPIPRWSILAGKLVALVPIAIALQLVSLAVATLAGWGHLPSAASFAGFAVAVIAVSAIATGISTLVPRYGMALTMFYMLLFDLVIGELPASLREISITAQAREIASHGDVVQAVVMMAIVGGVWLGIALWRVRRIEA